MIDNLRGRTLRQIPTKILGICLCLCCLPTAQAQFGFGNNSPINNAPLNSANSGLGNQGFGGATGWGNNWSQAVPTTTSGATNYWQGWSLGANIRDTDTGVLITQTTPGGAARAANLNEGDMVVTVNGFQVGLVGNKRYDILQEIHKRAAETNGVISLVYLPSGGNQLRRMTLDLNNSATSVSGVITLPPNTFLPPGSQLTVELRNRTHNFQEINGGVKRLQVSGTGPFRFDLNYDPRFIHYDEEHVLQAFVESGNQRLVGITLVNLNPNRGINNISLALTQPSVQTASGSIGSGSTQVLSPQYSYDGRQQIETTFRRFLLREPNDMELVGWQNALNRGTTIEQMTEKVLASPQFYDLMGQNPERFISQMFQLILQRNPTQQELNQYLQLYQQSGGARPYMVSQFMASTAR